MNAPYGGRNELAFWLEKFVAHGNGIVALKAAGKVAAPKATKPAHEAKDAA